MNPDIESKYNSMITNIASGDHSQAQADLSDILVSKIADRLAAYNSELGVSNAPLFNQLDASE